MAESYVNLKSLWDTLRRDPRFAELSQLIDIPH